MNKQNSSSNLKTKIISLLTAVALWLYVIAVVDPDEKKVIENIPITITNVSEIQKDGFVIYPHKNFMTDVTVEGKLSEIQKLNKNNVHVYGDIINPVEGQNIINLRTNISNRVSRDLKDNTLVVDLEKKISKKVNVKIKIPDAMKSTIERAKVDIDEVEVSGPRTLINKVSYVGAVLSFNDDRSGPDTTTELNLVAYDKQENPINVNINHKKVKVLVKFTVEKTVPVKINFDGDRSLKSSIKISPEKLTIVGDNDTVKNIEDIMTQPLTDKDLSGLDSNTVKIVVPSNVRIKNNVTEVTLTKE